MIIIAQSCIKMVGAILNLSAFFLEPSRNWSPVSTHSPNLTSQASSVGSIGSDPHSSTSSSSAGSSGATVRASSDQHHEIRKWTLILIYIDIYLQINSNITNTLLSCIFLGSAQFMVIVSEKQARVYQVPASLQALAYQRNNGSSISPGGTVSGGAPQSHPSTSSTSSINGHQDQHSASFTQQMSKFLSNKTNCLAKSQLSDTSFARKSAVVSWRQPIEGECCMVNYLATGNLIVHSLPHLRPLMDADFVPETSPLISSSMLMGRNGHCLYQPSAMEICKFTISSQYKSMLSDMCGTLFTPREMPEMARPNFFKSLFSVASSAASKQSERDELFGESGAGKPSRTVAKHIAGLDKIKLTQGGLAANLLDAREGLNERGEKLSDLEDRTLAMMNQAETYSQAAGQLAQKYKDKKWYQF